MPAQNSPSVQAVERAFDILEVIARSGGECSLSDISDQTSMALSTIHRLLRTLISIGHVRQLPNRRYALGPRLTRLGEVANRQLGALAAPVLHSLVEELSESASLAVLDGDMVIYTGQVPSPHTMRTTTEVGRRVNLHNSGVGKAVLAVLDDPRIARLVTQAGLPAPTPNTLTSLSSVFAEVERIREQGYAVDDQEQELGVRCFAMSVPGAPTPMAIGVSGPVPRVDDAFAQRVVPALRRATETISSALIGGRDTP